MPTFLSDPSPTVYGVLGVMVVALAGLWLRGRSRGDLFRLIAGVAVLTTFCLIDHFVESPREEATRKMEEIRAATKAKNVDAFATNVSESFHYEGKNKAQLLDKVRGAFQMAQFAGIDMSGFGRSDVDVKDNNTIKIGFESWPTGFPLGLDIRFYVWATFVKDPDGQYRMQTFDLYQPAKRPTMDQKPVVPDQLR